MFDDRSSDSVRTDVALLEEIRDPRNREAWERFIARYGPMIRGWCRHWFPHDAEDGVQEVYAKLVAHLKTFEYNPAIGRFRGWLKTVTNRLMADLKEVIPPAALYSEAVLDDAIARMDLFERLAAEYDLELLEKAKKRVRRRVSEQTWLAYVEMAEKGRDPAELARELGITPNAVYQAKHTVVSALRSEVMIRKGLF
jgi:RNA polymerase sigma-70 factor (ECF subfamily)